eukprot:605813-Pleurochrysis_carterae.AAC.1
MDTRLPTDLPTDIAHVDACARRISPLCRMHTDPHTNSNGRSQTGIHAHADAHTHPHAHARRFAAFVNPAGAQLLDSLPTALHRIAALNLPERPNSQGEHWTISHDKGMNWNTWLRFKMKAIFEYSVRANWKELQAKTAKHACRGFIPCAKARQSHGLEFAISSMQHVLASSVGRGRFGTLEKLS